MNFITISFCYEGTGSNEVELHLSDNDADFLFWLSGYLEDKCDVTLDVKRVK